MIPLLFSPFYLSFWFVHKETRQEVVTQKVETLSDINFDKLREEGIKLIIFDYDDTLSGQEEPLSEETRNFLKDHSEASSDPAKRFHLAILSNRSSSQDQITPILDDTVLYFKIGSHRKPHPDAFLPILKEHALEPSQVAMVGDRGGTDMWGAYRLGFRERILITPVSNRTGKHKPGFWFRFIRKIENSRL